MGKSGPVNAHPVTWTVRVLWLALPFTVGDALGDALARRSAPVQHVVVAGSWIGWAAGLVALVVALPVMLTAVRFVVPAAIAVAAWTTWRSDATALSIAGLVVSVVAAVLAWSGYVADDFVDGASYGDERRFALRSPAVLVIGPLPLAVAVATAGVAAGPLLLAAKRWAAGVALVAVGWLVAAAALRSLHTLSRRFVVFVPAGITLVDPALLVDAVLVPRSSLVQLGPAPLEGDRLDLSGQALGLALELVAVDPLDLTVKDGRRSAHELSARRVVFTPARPSAVLAEAARRRLPVSV
jgi:hypothetical protein